MFINIFCIVMLCSVVIFHDIPILFIYQKRVSHTTLFVSMANIFLPNLRHLQNYVKVFGTLTEIYVIMYMQEKIIFWAGGQNGGRRESTTGFLHTYT